MTKENKREVGDESSEGSKMDRQRAGEKKLLEEDEDKYSRFRIRDEEMQRQGM